MACDMCDERENDYCIGCGEPHGDLREMLMEEASPDFVPPMPRRRVGDWNQCSCGDGYQETAKTLAAGKCASCIGDAEDRERSWIRSCADYGCPFCMSLGCAGGCVASRSTETTDGV